MSERFSPGESTLAETKEKVSTPRLFRVLLHNDDFTTMDFVVFVLENFFGTASAEATRLMLQVHQEGSCDDSPYYPGVVVRHAYFRLPFCNKG